MLEDIEHAIKEMPKSWYVIQWLRSNRLFISFTELAQDSMGNTIYHHANRLRRIGYDVRVYQGAMLVIK